MAKRRNGNPKTADGFIRISNELWDAWMCSRFTAREERMIKVVIRFSYGMNRSFALLSKSDLARFMNEHLPNVDKILKALLARGVIRVEAAGAKGGPFRLFLNKRYREWQVDQALRKDPDFFGKVARRMFGDGAAPDETGYQFDKPGDQKDNVEVIDSITGGLSDREPPGDRSDNRKQDQDAETVYDIPSGRHKQTEEDIGLSTSSVKVPSPVPDGHPFFAPLVGDQAFWNALAVAYPTQDIPAQVRKMTAWLMANPKRRHRDYKRFIQAWLAREEREEKNHGKSRTDARENPAPFSDIPPELIA